MIQVATGIIIAYLTTFFLLPLIIKLAHQNKIYDVPDERKTHNYPVSSLGGIAIFSGLILSMLLVSDFNNYNAELQYYVAGLFVIFILGLIDDIFILKAWKKTLGQLAVAAVLTLKGGLLVTNLHGFLGMHALTHTESVYISFFTIILLINAFNLLDGVDGLAASIGLVACLLFGVFFLINNVLPYAVLAFSIAGALLSFLMYNFPPAKIFMGDSGSTLIGLICSMLAIKFVENPAIQVNLTGYSTPAIAFGFLLIPLMDVLRVFALRIAKGKSPLIPDRSHFHHLLQNKGLSHTEVTITLLAGEFVFALITLLLHNININIVIASQFILYFTSVYILKRFVPVRKKLHIVREEDEEETGDSKVYLIYPMKEKVSANED
ncbi:MAG TPA: MraY family glycosyltransferase [Parafilimonas sp.]|nr:MraY family glycosyltransferase [Parafilimonas sp.]